MNGPFKILDVKCSEVAEWSTLYLPKHFDYLCPIASVNIGNLVGISVTVRLDYLFNIWPFAAIKMCQILQIFP